MAQSFATLSADTDSAASFPSLWNLVRSSLLSTHSGSSRPSYAASGTLWYNSTSKTINFYDGAQDVPVMVIDEVNHYVRQPSGSGASVLASATSLDLGSVPDNFVTISGTANITDFGSSMKPGQVKFCVASGTFTLVYNSTNLILPGAANITASLGDAFAVLCLSSGKYRVPFYTPLTTQGGFTTGDTKLTLKTVADNGWVIADDGTIGNAGSGATTRANADCAELYSLVWDKIPDSLAPVTGGRGGSASADFAAQKAMKLPRTLGRVLGVAGIGSGLTSRALGSYLGTETHLLTENELAVHDHPVNDPGHTHNLDVSGGPGGVQRLIGSPNQAPNILATASSQTGLTVGNAGGNSPHNNMQPTSFFNLMIKL